MRIYVLVTKSDVKKRIKSQWKVLGERKNMSCIDMHRGSSCSAIRFECRICQQCDRDIQHLSGPCVARQIDALRITSEIALMVKNHVIICGEAGEGL